MESLAVTPNDPSEQQLADLSQRCEIAQAQLKAGDSEVRLPLFAEFAGSPKSGKTTIIGTVGHFFKRMGFSVGLPTEGASLRTPSGLRDDWLAFNTWSACYALQQILVYGSEDPCVDLVILDRGLFDVAAWLEFLTTAQGRMTEEDRDQITRFIILDLWRRRENLVFLFTADHATSMHREHDGKLTQRGGSVMNASVLSQLKGAYNTAATRLDQEFPNVYHIDTSFINGRPPSFMQIAYSVAERIVSLLENVTSQMLLVTKPVRFEGFIQDRNTVKTTVREILAANQPRFMKRGEAEKSLKVQQVVPYAILRNPDNLYFCARRRHDVSRRELQGKYTLLVGGHAEHKDWNEAPSAGVFERCLRREIEEELIGCQLHSVQPLGFVNDVRNAAGSHHLAFIHQVTVGGRPLIRRQSLDQEFGRETVTWKTPDEVGNMIRDLDPWSQLVASALFGVSLPESPDDPTLFSPRAQDPPKQSS